jgi:Ca2+-binding RTX toxin-like protein
MATINFEDAVADPTLVEDFDPNNDVLNFPNDTSTDVQVLAGSTETTFRTTAGEVTLPVAAAALDGLGAGSNVTFANNSVLFIGDGTVDTTFDDFGKTVTYTSAEHLIFGLGGNDVIKAPATQTLGVEIYGNTGNDALTGATGADTLFGGQGTESLSGATGSDLVYGNQGNDSISGNKGSDTLFGGQGADSMGNAAPVAGTEAGNDLIYGNKGSDSISGGSGNDTLFGGQDDDSITGGATGADSVYGNQGDDTLSGGAGTGNDTLFGGQGDDSITDGGSGSDLIYGNKGDDVISEGGGSDTIFGNAGADSVLMAADGSTDAILGGAGADTVNGSGVADSVSDQIAFDAGDDVFIMNQTSYTKMQMLGGADNDTLVANTTGGFTLNSQFGGFEDIQIGTTTTIGGGVTVNAAGQLNTGYNVFVASPAAGTSLTYTGTNNGDTVTGGSAADGINGGSGTDILKGGSGADGITGCSGDDQLFGGAGVDTLFAGRGADEITGGAGNDLIIDNDFREVDTLVDFDTGNDTLLLNIDAGAKTTGGNTFEDTAAGKGISEASGGAGTSFFLWTTGAGGGLGTAALGAGSVNQNATPTKATLGTQSLFTGAKNLSALKSSITGISRTATGTALVFGTTTGANKLYLFVASDTKTTAATGESFLTTKTIATIGGSANIAGDDIALF